MPSVRVQRIQHVAGAAEQLSSLPGDVLQELYARLDEYKGQEHALGTHAEYLNVEGFVILVDLFVDVDGTLWIERMAHKKP